MIAALAAEVDATADDPSVRVVILAAAGKGFCAGHDLKEMRAHVGDKAWQRELFDQCGRMMISLTRLPQPVIARVHGIATAAGCQLVSMCDLAVAADSAAFALPGVNIGVFCSTPAVGVVRNVGRKRAMEMLLTGEMIDAQPRCRGASSIESSRPPRSTTRSVASRTSFLPAARRLSALGKEAFYQQVERPLEDAYAMTSDAMACNLLLDDAAEGMDAFLGKRPAVWQGR